VVKTAKINFAPNYGWDLIFLKIAKTIQNGIKTTPNYYK